MEKTPEGVLQVSSSPVRRLPGETDSGLELMDVAALPARRLLGEDVSDGERVDAAPTPVRWLPPSVGGVFAEIKRGLEDGIDGARSIRRATAGASVEIIGLRQVIEPESLGWWL